MGYVNVIEPAEGQKPSLDDRIDDLYTELDELMAASEDDASLAGRIDDRFAKLRKLQLQEAEEMRKRFEARRLQDPADGLRVLQEARELIGESPVDLWERSQDRAPGVGRSL